MYNNSRLGDYTVQVFIASYILRKCTLTSKLENWLAQNCLAKMLALSPRNAACEKLSIKMAVVQRAAILGLTNYPCLSNSMLQMIFFRN